MPDAACARFEPAIAAMMDGTLDAKASTTLVEHLRQCATCNEVAAAVSLVREDVRALPEPRPCDAVEPRVAMVPSWIVPRTVWARTVQLAMVAAVFLIVGYLLAPRSQPAATYVAPDPSLADPDVPRPEPVLIRPGGEASVALPAPTAEPSSTQLEEIEVLPHPVLSAPERLDGSVGYVAITCQPACLRVEFDGASLGPSPIVRQKVAAGTHVVVAHWDAQKKAVTVAVEGGKTRSIALSMPDAPAPSAGGTGRVSVVCSPACERILIDGKNVGPSPLVQHRVVAGAHDFAFVRGSERKSQRVVIEDGTIVPIRVMMSGESSNEGYGHVSVVCLPYCEQILIDGKDVGSSPLSQHRVAAGAHDFTFVRGRERKHKRLVVEARTTVPIRVMMSEPDNSVR